MTPYLFSFLQACIVIATAPLMVCIIRAAKARLQNRQGASVLQPYWSLASLARKEMTVTKHSSWVFRTAPFAILIVSFLLALFVPTVASETWAAQYSNVFLLAAVLTSGSLWLVLGGMDAASAFGGMGASREMTLAALIEPAAIMIFVTLGSLTKSWNLDGIVASLTHTSWLTTNPFLILTFIAFGCVILAENARYPVDNPATHLELTMVHEAMILEYSGPFLAMIELAAAIKLTALSVFFLHLVLPIPVLPVKDITSAIIDIISYTFKLALSGILIAIIESILVKMRFYRMQEFMTATYCLGLAGLVLSLLFARATL